MYRPAGRSGGGGGAASDVVGKICPPGLDRVNIYLKKDWGSPGPAPLAPALYYVARLLHVATHALDSGLGMVLKWSYKESGETYFELLKLYSLMCAKVAYTYDFPLGINVWKLCSNVLFNNNGVTLKNSLQVYLHLNQSPKKFQIM